MAEAIKDINDLCDNELKIRKDFNEKYLKQYLTLNDSLIFPKNNEQERM